MLSRTLVIGLLFYGFGALAQIPPSEFDASIPDASMGNGGAETSQEMEEHPNTVCMQSHDCERGFACTNGRCSYAGYRMATQPGCLGATATMLIPLLVFWGWRRRGGDPG